MIIFELACGQGHRFEGWFASADDFARQSDDEMVHCPVCDDGGVIRVPSAKCSLVPNRTSGMVPRKIGNR